MMVLADAGVNVNDALNVLTQSGNVLFLLLGAIMIFAMHAGFAFLEVGSVRKKSQVNALNKILFEWGISAVIYFMIGYPIARGVHFFVGVDELTTKPESMIKFFLYLGFAACIPAIISGGVAERAKFWTNSLAGAIFVGLAYPLLESVCWGQLSDKVFGPGSWLANLTGCPNGFHDYAGSVVVHSMGGWLALPAVLILGPRRKRYAADGTSAPINVSSIPFLALGSWILCAGWFGFNVMSAGHINSISALVAVNSLMAMVGGVISANLLSRNDAGFTHNGALAGLVAICAGSDIYHPIGSLFVGAIAGAIFVYGFHIVTEKLRIDDVLGVWPLHGLCGSWGGFAAGIFGLKVFGGTGGVSFSAQAIVTGATLMFAFFIGALVYGVLNMTFGIRLTDHEELLGPDLSIHHVEAQPEEAM